MEAKNLTGYRFGIGETAFQGYRAYGHTGYWNTFSYYFPDLDLAIAGSILQNGRYKVGAPLVARVLDRIRPGRAALIARLESLLRTTLASDSTVLPGPWS